MRQRQLIVVIAVICFCIVTFTAWKIPRGAAFSARPYSEGISEAVPPPKKPEKHQEHGSEPMSVASTASHPIHQLITDARAEFDTLKERQSKSLGAAVKEYRRRYGIPPPPHFDKWYEFARKKGVQLIDEFDVIHDVMTPFWGLSPKTIRSRAREALGNDNFLLGVAIRDHKITLEEGGKEWQRNATRGLLEKFIEHLPDMDLAFNAHDEPRVMVPHDDLSRLISKAKDATMAAASAATNLRNSFSKASEELGEGKAFKETKLTRFNEFPQQATWTTSRMSCHPDSPARTLEDEEPQDAREGYGISDLGFVYNLTAMTDICMSPSVQSTWGFFSRPNAFSVVHDLFPIFSQSKISSYADIIYPSPWYWYEKVPYDEEKDMKWSEKADKLYWRGSTTGGFSRNGGWRRQHRQNFVQKINARDEAKIMTNNGTDENPFWQTQSTPRGDHRQLIDVHFSHVGQCDAGDCEAQTQFFEVVEHVEQQEAWASKYLLDMDGNAFSGRFYAFLKSRSMVFKLAIFREWHNEWLKPWVHYVPLSLRGDDWLEAVRFFSDSTAGGVDAEKLAMDSRSWAGKTVRQEDMEAWFFRLLLE